MTGHVDPAEYVQCESVSRNFGLCRCELAENHRGLHKCTGQTRHRGIKSHEWAWSRPERQTIVEALARPTQSGSSEDE
jgi:hypothetical protein